MNLSTWAVHGGRPDSNGAPLVPDIAIAAAYGFEDVESYDSVRAGRSHGYLYSGDDSPSSEQLEGVTALLEGASAGVAVPSGMAAMAFALLALLPNGGNVVVSQDIFGGSRPFLETVLTSFNFGLTWVDLGDVPSLERTLAKNGAGTSVVLGDSISNPLLRVVDLDEVAEVTHRAAASLVVDNTLATPWFCHPLEHGADVVVHSASKYLGGHSDLVAGLCVGAEAIVARIRELAIRFGARLDPFTSWLALRGVRTLPLRMERAGQNAAAVASWLAANDDNMRVLYPGLAPTQLTRRLLPRGFGAIVSVDLVTADAAMQFVRSLKMIRFVGSLGDVSTTVNHPITTSHRGMAVSERSRLGVTEGLVRLSIGIEDIGDILADIEGGLRSL